MNPWAPTAPADRSMAVLGRNIDRESKDRYVLSKLASKLSRVPAPRPSMQTRAEREAEVWWHREQLLHFFRVHRKRLARLNVRLEDFFQESGTVAYKGEVGSVLKASDGGKTSAFARILRWVPRAAGRLFGRGC